MCICCTEQTTADNTSSSVVMKSALLNGSSDDLWTDTDDESFVRATQCVLDAAADGFTSPMAVGRCTAVTSTPNIKSSRCRRTFCLDPTPKVPCRVNMRPRRASPAVPAVTDTISPLVDAGISDELLATLAEPDEVLDSQVKLTDAAVALESHNPVLNTATERRDVCAVNMKGTYHLIEKFA